MKLGRTLQMTEATQDKDAGYTKIRWTPTRLITGGKSIITKLIYELFNYNNSSGDQCIEWIPYMVGAMAALLMMNIVILIFNLVKRKNSNQTSDNQLKSTERARFIE